MSHALWVLARWSFQKQARKESNILCCRQKTGNSWINFLFRLFNPTWIPDRNEEEEFNLEVLNSLEQHIKPAEPDFPLAQFGQLHTWGRGGGGVVRVRWGERRVSVELIS